MRVAKRANRCKVIAICNQKGGVTKSASTVHLAAALTKLDYKVLVIDADSQASLTKNLGFRDIKEDDFTIATLFINQILINDGDEAIFDELEPGDGILEHEEGFDLFPSNILLAGLEKKLGEVYRKEEILKNYVDMERPYYDFILIDCMPSLGLITVNSLAAADSVLIPAEADLTSANGIQDIITSIEKMKRAINPNLEIEGILLAKVDLRTNYAREMRELIIEAYKERVKFFEKDIPATIKVAECAAIGKSIFSHDPKGKAAEAYMSLAREVSE